jgi:energy-coupling factor transport system permease protein
VNLVLYVPAGGALHRLHPVSKLGGLLALVVAAFLVDHPAYLAPLGIGVLLLHAVAGTGRILVRFRALFVLVFVFTLVVWTFFYRTVFTPTWTGFVFGLSTGLRLDTFLATGLLFLGVTRVEEVAYALGRLGVPHLAGFTLTLSFRLVPVFFESATTIVQAQRCRGLALEGGGVASRLRRFAPVIVPVFIGALRRADRMAMALELRGFNSGRPRTTWLRARAGWRDAVAAAVALATVAIYVTIWHGGAGTLPR